MVYSERMKTRTPYAVDVTGGGRSSAISRRMSANKVLGMATSAIGLSYSYLKKRLEQWGEGFHAAAEPMPQVASKLSLNEIEALASYLSFVEYDSLE
jgi:hypothetical protein